MLYFFPLDVLDEISDLIESVSDGIPTYSCCLGKPYSSEIYYLHSMQTSGSIMPLAASGNIILIQIEMHAVKLPCLYQVYAYKTLRILKSLSYSTRCYTWSLGIDKRKILNKKGHILPLRHGLYTLLIIVAILCMPVANPTLYMYLYIMNRLTHKRRSIIKSI